jgi:hypothetical protein
MKKVIVVVWQILRAPAASGFRHCLVFFLAKDLIFL